MTEILDKIGGTGVVPSEADPANKAAMLRQALGRRFRIRDHETLEPTPILLNQFKKRKKSPCVRNRMRSFQRVRLGSIIKPALGQRACYTKNNSPLSGAEYCESVSRILKNLVWIQTGCRHTTDPGPGRN